MSERSTVQRIGDLEQMVTSFRRHLRAENKADQTITAYTYAPLQLAAFLAGRGMPTDVANIHREHIEAFLEDLLTRRSAATANNRYRGLVAFFARLTDEGEIPTSPLARTPEGPVECSGRHGRPLPLGDLRSLRYLLAGAALRHGERGLTRPLPSRQPPIRPWRGDQWERFEADLRRLRRRTPRT